MTEDEMDGWHHPSNGLNGHEFEKTLGDGEGRNSGKFYIKEPCLTFCKVAVFSEYVTQTPCVAPFNEILLSQLLNCGVGEDS